MANLKKDAASVPVRPALMSLVGDPASADAQAIWNSLEEQEQLASISDALSKDEDLASHFAHVLHCRKQTLQANPEKYAPRVRIHADSGDHTFGFLVSYSRPVWTSFFSRIRASAREDGSRKHRAKGYYLPARVSQAAAKTFAEDHPERLVVLLLTVRLVDPVLRKDIDPWLATLNRGVERMIEEGRRLAQIELDEAALVSEDEDIETDEAEVETSEGDLAMLVRRAREPDAAESRSPEPLNDFLSRIEAVESELRELASDLKAAGEAAETSLLLPPAPLAERIAAVRKNVEMLADSVGGRFEDLGSLRKAAERYFLQTSRVKLIAVAGRSLTADISVPGLDKVLTDAESLAAMVDADDPAAYEALRPGHPLVAILRLLMMADSLDESEAAGLAETVSSTYGLPLLSALYRGKLKGLEPWQDQLREMERSRWSLAAAQDPVSPALADDRRPTENAIGSPLESVPAEPTADKPLAATTVREDLREADHSAPEAIATTKYGAAPAELYTQPGGSVTALHVERRSTTTVPEQVEYGVLALARARNSSLQDLASAFLQADPARRDSLHEEILARLVEHGQPALASHVTPLTDSALLLPPWLLKTLALAPEIKQAAGGMEAALQQEFASFTPALVDAGDEWDRGVSLMLAAAALRPAILASSTLAATVLGGIRFVRAGLEGTYEMVKLAVEHSVPGRTLDRAVLGRLLDVEIRETLLEQVVSRAEQWLTNEPRRRLLFSGATEVWRKWNEQNGPIHDLLDPVRRNAIDSIGQVRLGVETLSDRARTEQRINTTQVTKGRRDIEARALAQLLTRVSSAVAIARDWIAYHELRTGSRSRQQLKDAERFRRSLLSFLSSARTELARASEDPQVTIIELAGTRALRRTLDDLERLLSDPSRLGGDEASPDIVLMRPLLRFPSIGITADCSSVERPQEIAAQVIDSLAEGELSWEAAFQERLGRHDFVATALMLETAALEGAASGTVEQLESHRASAINHSRSTVRRAADQTRLAIEQAVMQGLLTETERARWLEPVELAVRALDRDGGEHEFRSIMESLARNDRELESRRGARVSNARDRLTTFRGRIDESDFDRVAHVINEGDVFTAEEFLAQLESGQPLPHVEYAPEADDRLIEFFPEVVRYFDRNRLGPRPDVVRALRMRVPVGCLTFDQLTEAQAERAAAIVEDWFRGDRSSGNPVKDIAKRIFQFLGFDVRLVEVGGKANRAWMELRTDPVRDRLRCPVWRFGSGAAAGGAPVAMYRVLWVWDQPSPDDLVAKVGDTANVEPTFVFYFGCLSEDRRRALARLCRERRRTFLVLDDTLLLRLVAEPDARMSLLFALSLPFTFVEPYVTTAGLVPPELFYGRERERQELVEPAGSNFVYGGRQLGKTALLRQVERSFHDPSSGRVAIFVDLVAHGIGPSHPPAALWPLLVRELKEKQVLKSDTKISAAPENLIRQIGAWLEEDGRRRILLLLDEADRFLDADEQFQTVRELKRLMEETDRRFKIVFSGLHNVQRMTRVSNNPLAHLGRPIVIGPLYNGEWREARSLLEDPLRSLGYRFASGDLPLRLLSHTNYYPSLIQLTGRYLLSRLRREGVFDPAATPPYVITGEHVDDVIRDPELRRELRNRFIWTLQLDARYRLIAFMMAERALRVPPPDPGMTPSEVHREALFWYRGGVGSDRSEEVFRVLLDELVELRILRRDSDGRYALLNANIMLLLGTAEEIESELMRMSEGEAIEPFQPSMFRRQKTGEASGYRRSPLTTAQEGRLLAFSNGVAVITGSVASGVNDVGEFLRDLPATHLTGSSAATQTFADFDRLMDQAVDERRAHSGISLVIVSQDSPWDARWVEVAVERTNRLTAPEAWLRVIFVADAARAWQLAGASEFPRLVGRPNVEMISLTPWHESMVAQWLDAIQLPRERAVLMRVRELTGYWHGLLMETAELVLEVGARRWESAMDRLEERWRNKPWVDQWRLRFGLTDMPNAELTQLLMSGESTSAAIVAEIIGDEPLVRQAFDWYGRLLLAERLPDDNWKPNELVRRLV